jgi:hypothetical protein
MTSPQAQRFKTEFVSAVPRANLAVSLSLHLPPAGTNYQRHIDARACHLPVRGQDFLDT